MISISEIKRQALEKVAGKRAPIILALLIEFVVLLVLAFIPIISNFVAIFSLLIGAGLYISIPYMTLKVVDEEDITVEDGLHGFKNGYLENFCTYLLVSLFTFLWSLLLIIPGIIKGISYSMTPFIKAENPEKNATDCIRESMEMMDGHKMDCFLLTLSFVGWYLLSLLTLGILLIWVVPYQQASLAQFYHEVSNRGNKIDDTVVIDSTNDEYAI